MKTLVLLIALSICSTSFAQPDARLTTIDFVQVLDENKEETIFYYQNNWKVLREMAIEKGYIHSFQLLETPFSEEAPFEIMLITTYANQEQYDQREDHFGELIDQRGELRLMNDKEPGEFRNIIFHKDKVKHWK